MERVNNYYLNAAKGILNESVEVFPEMVADDPLALQCGLQLGILSALIALAGGEPESMSVDDIPAEELWKFFNGEVPDDGS